jgi:hypothetical protein
MAGPCRPSGILGNDHEGNAKLLGNHLVVLEEDRTPDPLSITKS